MGQSRLPTLQFHSLPGNLAESVGESQVLLRCCLGETLSKDSIDRDRIRKEGRKKGGKLGKGIVERVIKIVIKKGNRSSCFRGMGRKEEGKEGDLFLEGEGKLGKGIVE